MRTLINRHPVPASASQPGSTAHVVRRRWLPAWIGLAVLGVANGILRELAYADVVGDHAAHQLSTLTLVVMIAGYTWWLQRRWPLTSTADAVRIGALWVLMTVAFEFGFGHYVDGASWSALLADYDLTRGNLWVLVLVTIGLAPTVARRRVAEGLRPPTGTIDGSARNQ
jgi:hypothetical protein